jgi:DNA-binding MarR family transcriptional regulator
MDPEILAVLSVIAAAGLAGGYAGYLLGPPEPGELPTERRQWYLRRSLVLGVIAAFMVPLFLRFVGVASGDDKNLVDQLTAPGSPLSAWLVVTGVCLLAAVSSQRFISTLTNKLLESVRQEARSEGAKAAREEVQELEEDLVEQAAVRKTPQPITSQQKDILRALYYNREKRPTFDGIKRTGKWEAEALRGDLQDLEERGLVKSKIYEDGQKRWRVRTAGKALLAVEQLPPVT